MLFGNSEGDNNHIIEKLSKLLYILVLATLRMYIIATEKYFSTPRSVDWLRAPVYLSTVKPRKQIKRNAHVSMVNNVIYISVADMGVGSIQHIKNSLNNIYSIHIVLGSIP